MADRPVRTTRYINTDLDVSAMESLNWLVEYFARRKTTCLAHRRAGDGRWYAVFEYGVDLPSPEATVVGLLDQIEAMKPTTRAKWERCPSIEFNIGYDVGETPWAFNEALKPRTVERLASAGATIRWTLYPLASKEVAILDRRDEAAVGDPFAGDVRVRQPSVGRQHDDQQGGRRGGGEGTPSRHRVARIDFLASLVTYLTSAARGEYAPLDSMGDPVGEDVRARVKGYNELIHRVASAIRGGFPDLEGLDEVLTDIAAHHGLNQELAAARTWAYSNG